MAMIGLVTYILGVILCACVVWVLDFDNKYWQHNLMLVLIWPITLVLWILWTILLVIALWFSPR